MTRQWTIKMKHHRCVASFYLLLLLYCLLTAIVSQSYTPNEYNEQKKNCLWIYWCLPTNNTTVFFFVFFCFEQSRREMPERFPSVQSVTPVNGRWMKFITHSAECAPAHEALGTVDKTERWLVCSMCVFDVCVWLARTQSIFGRQVFAAGLSWSRCTHAEWSRIGRWLATILLLLLLSTTVVAWNDDFALPLFLSFFVVLSPSIARWIFIYIY